MTTSTATQSKNTTNVKEEMYIVKIKVNSDNTAAIFYRTSTDKEAKEVYYSGKDQITQAFSEGFQNLVEGFIGTITRLTPDKNKITMNVLKLDYDKNGFIKNALYGVKYAFNDQSNAVLNINTPPLPIYKEGMENTFSISGKHEEAIHEVIKLAKAYINGETRTKQMKLIVNNEE